VQHRVKGLGVSEFTKKELETLQNNGNKVSGDLSGFELTADHLQNAALIWRATWDAKKNPRPSNDNRTKLKHFMEQT
jgi:hypothetical protein